MILLIEIFSESSLNIFFIKMFLIIWLSWIKYTPKINGPKNVIIFDIWLLICIWVKNKEMDIECNINGNEDLLQMKSLHTIKERILLNPFCSFILIIVE